MGVVSAQNADSVREELEALVSADTLHMLPKEALIASIKDLAGRLLKSHKALHQTHHVIAFGPQGWSIEHLVECRPNMTECGFHAAAMAAATKWSGVEYPSGRYAVALDAHGALVVGAPIDGSGVSS